MSFEFKQQNTRSDLLGARLIVAFAAVVVFFLLLASRLAWLQIINKDSYALRAEQNRTVTIVTQGSRGLIYDRNCTLVAGNSLGYTLEITPDKVSNVDDTISELSKVISITNSDVRRFKRLREDFNRYDSIPIRYYLTDLEIATFTGQQWKFPGVEINQREHRIYPNGPLGSHITGYIGSISQYDQKRLKEEGMLDNYKGSRDIGKVGIERSYENVLHGVPGSETLEVSANGKSVRTLESIPARPGKNIELTIDMNLQRVAENAMHGRQGALIAIEPKTGAILAFVSLPTYDPNLFPGGIDPKSWKNLNSDESKPLLNRAIRGIYPIGSTYKPFMALAGLEMGATTKDYVLNDNGSFLVGKHRFRDLSGVPKGPVDLVKSLQVSSDVYYYWLATKLGVDNIYEFMRHWGFGQITGIDLIGEQKGLLPNREWKKRVVKDPWYVGDTPSLGIGQGYNSFTLLQLAHATATLANRGVVMKPHLVNAVIDPISGEKEFISKDPVEKIPLSPKNIDAVTEGMIAVTTKGTAKSIFRGAPYKTAGKTGTAQVITLAQDDKYDSKKLARRYHDHALFIAFAPAENPTIALSVIVENGGFGAKAAAPVAREVLDYWITGKNSLGMPAPSHIKQRKVKSN